MYMPFVTFIYKIGKRTYYGKYVFDSMSDDHNGLDVEIHPMVIHGVNQFRAQKNKNPLNDLKIGILSLSIEYHIPCYSSESEYECFDFYCDEIDYYSRKIYINGKLLMHGNQIMNVNA